jgi:dihydrolipoamide dehydrogenase
LSSVEVKCPDLGDFKNVTVIDLLVNPGEHVDPDTPILTLETDKATMDVPAGVTGTVQGVLVAKGERVSSGTALLRVESAGESAATAPASPAAGAAPAPAPAPVATPAPARAPGAAARAPGAAAGADAARGTAAPVTSAGASVPEPAAARSVALLVLGAGPGGYTAAFRAADLGLKVLLVDRGATLGGVCLNVGCIPSKALLHAAKVIEDARAMGGHGIVFGEPRVDFGKLRAWKSGVVARLTGGLAGLARQRKVEVLRGSARFVSPHVVEVQAGDRTERIRFEQCIIAAGSESVTLPFIPSDPRIIDSTGALELPEHPGRFLVIGGGIIGLEMACVFDALGAKLSVVELTAQLMPGCDPDLVRPLEKRLRARYAEILLGTRVTAVTASAAGLEVRFEDKDGGTRSGTYDHVLVAVGRTPNGKRIGAEQAGVNVDERGYIATDRQMRTNVAHIFAIGDVVGQPMLAHKATHEGKVAAEVAAGHKSHFDARVIPSVAYTDPEVAWAGLTETAAAAQGIAYEKSVFPWAASGRSLANGRDEGFTKLLFDPATRRLLGAGIVGTSAGDLIAEAAMAIETGADAADISLTIHPHPTLSETIAFAAEAFEGTLTDLYLPRKR